MTQSTEQERQAFEAWWGTWDSHAFASDGAKEFAFATWQAARRAQVVPDEVEKLREELAEEADAANAWRRLALQFDNHRMHAIWHLKHVLHPCGGQDERDHAEEFLKAPPLDGEAVLAERIAALAAAPQPPEAEKHVAHGGAENGQKTVETRMDTGFQRGAELAQVPRFNHAAKRKLELLMSDGATVTGYAFQKKDGRRGSIDCGGFVAWWPEADIGNPIANGNQQDAEAAPVQMPEPVAYIQHHKAGDNLEWDHPGGKHSALYTEHQVRELLARK